MIITVLKLTEGPAGGIKVFEASDATISEKAKMRQGTVKIIAFYEGTKKKRLLSG
jgi:hypothetical protein